MKPLTKAQAVDLIFQSLTALNEEKVQKIPVADDTVLLGTGTALDSLDLIFIITDIEERFFKLTNQEIQLAVDSNVFEGNHPFRTVSTLSEYITTLVQAG